MNDLLTDPKALAIALLGAVVGLLSFMGRSALRRIEHLEQNSVSKADLKNFHEENLGNFRELKEMLTRDQADARLSRHTLADRMGVVAGQVAKLEGRLEEMGKRS